MRIREAVIINDDHESLGDLEEILTVVGYNSVVVNDAFLAVDTVVQVKPDVILLELKMPRRNGFEIADEINNALQSNRIPIIAMSALFKDEFRFLFNLCGINRYLRKPLNPLDIIWALESLPEKNNSFEEESSAISRSQQQEVGYDYNQRNR